MTTILMLLTSVGLATAAQITLKAGMNRVGRIDSAAVADLGSLLGKVVTTWQVPLGLGLFGVSAVFWLITLSRVPLSTAYPVVSLSYVLILVFSFLVLHERPPMLVWVGALLIMSGIALVGLAQR